MAMTFEWWGREFPMADFAYNTTALNERAVELPIACWWLRNAGGRVLEVGNVLSHYYDSLPKRTVVDRYEGGDGVENIDVFEVTGEWNHIVSISTVEHVRWDEYPRESGGGQAAVEHLQSVLSPKGRMLLTVPLGWNQPLDDWLLDGDTGVDRACTLIRQNDRWVQTERPLWRPYGATQPWAESVWVGEWGTV